MQTFVTELRAREASRVPRDDGYENLTRTLLLGSGQCVHKLLTTIPGRDIDFLLFVQWGFGDIVSARLPRRNEPAKLPFGSGAEGVGRVGKFLLDAIAVLKSKLGVTWQEAKSGGKGQRRQFFPHSLGAKKDIVVFHV